MYQAGWSKKEIAIKPRGYAMFGYGMWHHRARAQKTPLFARAFFLRDENGHSLIFCCLDFGYVSHAMRSGACQVLRERMGDAFNEAEFVLACTHTHSGPGGCSHEALYNVVTPGFVAAHLQAIVTASTDAVLEAWETAAPTEIGLTQGAFDEQVPVAWNRSLQAYNCNPDVRPRGETETHLALDRSMQVLGFRRNGELQALLSFFGVHATCLGNSLHSHDGDNKGYAAAQAEQALQEAGVKGGVAIFAQATAGDVSPHYQGPGDVARRRRIKGEAEYDYARQNGRHQSDRALSMLGGKGIEQPVVGGIDSIFGYFDFTAIKAEPRFADGDAEAWTSEPCHGVAFFTGTRIDGVGMPAVIGVLAKFIAGLVKKKRLKNIDQYPPDEQSYLRRLYAAQGPKAILLEAGRKRILGQELDKLALPGFVDPTIKELKRQVRIGAIKDSAMVPTVLPLQIVIVGQLALVCCPGEFTTTAGRRVMQEVEAGLRARDIKQVLICTYCNDYMGYVTTQQEYREQLYEGGHTVFGQWTLAAFQTRFAELAAELLKTEAARTHDRTMRPKPVPAAELALRTDIPVPG